MCSSTRFPEAIPLRSIDKSFHTFWPTKINLVRSRYQFCGSCIPTGNESTGYKTVQVQCIPSRKSGSPGKSHQTLKTIIKVYCIENSRDWVEGEHLLLFAVRESVQVSLGFSPFELVFGHVVRGPLLVLKEKWLDEDPVLKYVAIFTARLIRAGQMAKRNLHESQSKMKVWYDRKTKLRSFKPGDTVLVLFPVVGNPLQAKYSGPYKVVKKISDTNYLVKTHGRREETQVCHINMHKAHHEKPKPELVIPNHKLGL